MVVVIVERMLHTDLFGKTTERERARGQQVLQSVFIGMNNCYVQGEIEKQQKRICSHERRRSDVRNKCQHPVERDQVCGNSSSSSKVEDDYDDDDDEKNQRRIALIWIQVHGKERERKRREYRIQRTSLREHKFQTISPIENMMWNREDDVTATTVYSCYYDDGISIKSDVVGRTRLVSEWMEEKTDK